MFIVPPELITIEDDAKKQNASIDRHFSLVI
jgi:hypothetical protein